MFSITSHTSLVPALFGCLLILASGVSTVRVGPRPIVSQSDASNYEAPASAGVDGVLTVDEEYENSFVTRLPVHAGSSDVVASETFTFDGLTPRVLLEDKADSQTQVQQQQDQQQQQQHQQQQQQDAAWPTYVRPQIVSEPARTVVFVPPPQPTSYVNPIIQPGPTLVAVPPLNNPWETLRQIRQIKLEANNMQQQEVAAVLANLRRTVKALCDEIQDNEDKLRELRERASSMIRTCHERRSFRFSEAANPLLEDIVSHLEQAEQEAISASTLHAQFKATMRTVLSEMDKMGSELGVVQQDAEYVEPLANANPPAVEPAAAEAAPPAGEPAAAQATQATPPRVHA